MAQLGADVDELDRLGRTFERAAERLRGSRDHLQSALAGVSWMGPDADGFRTTWRTSMSAQLGEIADVLRSQSTVLQRQAREQRTASESGGIALVAFSPQLPTPQQPTTPPPAVDARGQTLAQILQRYQVADGTMVEWEPPWPESLLTDPRQITQHEADMLDDLGTFGRKDFKDIHDTAFDVADQRYDPSGGQNDNHNDAFRHTYWNALMTQRYGEQWAKDYASAHEQIPGNGADREAMDLYNNELGRRIATEHPDASPKELADLVQRAVEDGDAIVIDANGDLAFSDQVEVGHTGTADDGPAAGQQPDPNGDSHWGGGYNPGGGGDTSGTTTSGNR
jgi:hypothetical protein